MKILYKLGDVTEADECIIAHGCNAQGVMGSGVAKAIREKFPMAYETYSESKLVLGMNIWVGCGQKTIVNCITQKDYGRSIRQYVDYEAVARCIFDINSRAKLTQPDSKLSQFSSFALPMIGSGLGGGDWNIIENIIETETPDVQPIVYRFRD